MKKHFKDAISRDNSFGFELDIYIPSIKIGIEYDGVYFHDKRKNGMSDNTKDEKCIQQGINLIRIREAGLSKTKKALCIFRESESNSSLEKCIISLLNILKVIVDEPVSIQKDFSRINSQYTESYKESSFGKLKPEIAKEWHPTKNGTLTPFQVSVSSGKDCWWLCPNCGKEWSASPATRAEGHGCSQCARRLVGEKNRKNKLIVGVNDLETLFPEIAAEWDFDNNRDNPSEYLAGSNKSRYWICRKCGNSYQSKISNRTILGRGCKKCGIKSSSLKRSRKVRCIETGSVFESVAEAAEWLGSSRSLISRAANKTIAKAKGYTWEFLD